jgi:hypothetical protein
VIGEGRLIVGVMMSRVRKQGQQLDNALYSAVFGLVMTLQLRRDIRFMPLVALLSGALVGTPVGV